MLCCALSALAVAAAPWWRRFVPADRARPAALGLAAAAALLSVTVFEHAGHYAARAAASDRTLLAEILAQPLCTGEPADRAAADAATP
jgi:hypothetical protein